MAADNAPLQTINTYEDRVWNLSFTGLIHMANSWSDLFAPIMLVGNQTGCGISQPLCRSQCLERPVLNIVAYGAIIRTPCSKHRLL